MKNRLVGVFLACGGLALAFAAGCSSPSPYAARDSWAIRQNAIPQYATKYDVLYFYPELVDWRVGGNALAIHDEAAKKLAVFENRKTARDYDRKARLFVPFVHPDTREDDIEESIRFYLGHYHDPGRPFVVAAEGESVETVTNVIRRMSGWFGSLKKEDGLVASFLSPDQPLPFDQDLVSMASRMVLSRFYEQTWDRLAPLNTNDVPVHVLEVLHVYDCE